MSSASFSPILPDGLARYCHLFPVEAPECMDTYVFQLNNSGVVVNVTIKDKFLKEYIFQAETDDMGFFEISTELFPEGFFSSYGGIKTITAVLNGDPKSELLFFRTELGYFPGLYLKTVDTTWINVINPGSYIIDQNRFVCCCGDSIQGCSNFTINPCKPGELQCCNATPIFSNYRYIGSNTWLVDFVISGNYGRCEKQKFALVNTDGFTITPVSINTDTGTLTIAGFGEEGFSANAYYASQCDAEVIDFAFTAPPVACCTPAIETGFPELVGYEGTVLPDVEGIYEYSYTITGNDPPGCLPLSITASILSNPCGADATIELIENTPTTGIVRLKVRCDCGYNNNISTEIRLERTDCSFVAKETTVITCKDLPSDLTTLIPAASFPNNQTESFAPCGSLAPPYSISAGQVMVVFDISDLFFELYDFLANSAECYGSNFQVFEFIFIERPLESGSDRFFFNNVDDLKSNKVAFFQIASAGLDVRYRADYNGTAGTLTITILDSITDADVSSCEPMSGGLSILINGGCNNLIGTFVFQPLYNLYA